MFEKGEDVLRQYRGKQSENAVVFTRSYRFNYLNQVYMTHEKIHGESGSRNHFAFHSPCRSTPHADDCRRLSRQFIHTSPYSSGSSANRRLLPTKLFSLSSSRAPEDDTEEAGGQAHHGDAEDLRAIHAKFDRGREGFDLRSFAPSTGDLSMLFTGVIEFRR